MKLIVALSNLGLPWKELNPHGLFLLGTSNSGCMRIRKHSQQDAYGQWRYSCQIAIVMCNWCGVCYTWLTVTARLMHDNWLSGMLYSLGQEKSFNRDNPHCTLCLEQFCAQKSYPKFLSGEHWSLIYSAYIPGFPLSLCQAVGGELEAILP